MPNSCREQAVQAVLALLQSVSGITFERNRRTAIGSDELKIADRGVLFEGDEEQNDSFAGEDAFNLPLLVQFAAGKSGADGAAHCNAQRAAIQRALLANRTLGGLVRDLQITAPGEWLGVDIDSDDFEGFMLTILVRYATVEGDPFTFFN